MNFNRVLPVAAMTLGLTGMGLTSAQTLVPFSDPKIPFTFSYPQGWVGINLDDGTNGVSMVSAKAPPATMIRLLFVPKSGKPVNLTNELAGFEQGLKSTGVTVKMLSSRAASYGTLPGIEREYQITSGKTVIKLRTWFGNGAKNMYSFQLTDSVPRYAAASATFNKVLATVRFGR